jgi:diguanylate cyclase (GGDEF)-like protein/PAS domain S-box-containing protein
MSNVPPRNTSNPPPPQQESVQLHAIVEATPIAIVVVNERGLIVLANTNALHLFGYETEELLGKPVEQLVPERLRTVHGMLRSDYFHAPTSRPMGAGLEIFGVRKDGSEMPVEIGLNPLQSPCGKLVLAAIVDLTERRQTEERQHNEQQLRLVVDGAADALIMTDRDGHITLVNRQVERIFGYVRHELLKQPVEMLVPERFRSSDPIHREGPAGRNPWGLHEDVREIPIDAGLRPISTRRDDRVLASIVELSERKHADEMRMASARHARQVKSLNIELDSAEVFLEDSEQRSRRQAKRLAALWRIVDTSNLRGRKLIGQMLREAAAAVRPEHTNAGVLFHVDGSEYVIDCVSGELGPPDSGARFHLRVGTRMVSGATLHARDVKAGRTQSWEDVHAIPDLPARLREIGWRSLITTEFVAGTTVYVLQLGSIEPSPRHFGAEDYAYVEVLASIFARQLELEELDDSLRSSEEGLREHARRLEALLQIASNPKLREGERWTAMLQQGAASIRLGQPFRAMLARVRGDELVVEAVVDAPNHKAGDARTRIGHIAKLSETIFAEMLASGTATASWSDIQRTDSATARVRARGWHALIATTFAAADSTYVLSFASNEVAKSAFGRQDHTYVGILASIFANQAEVAALAQSLRDEEERARQHAGRLEALWKIVNDPTLRDNELWQAMLSAAAASIRSGQGFRGVLWRIVGTDMIIEALAESPEHSRPRFAAGQFPTEIGSVVPLDDTVVGFVLAEGGATQSWDDIHTSKHLSRLKRLGGMRSFVVTTFAAGGARWALSFSSRSVTTKPLGEQDTAYIEVLASFFANHVQQRWQFDRIQYQQSHDVLTGLLNRSQFRSRARLVSSVTTNFALILVDVNAFHEINESYGHIIGDALLVEIGNALQQRAGPDELVGRLGGDVFAIFVPNPRSKDAVLSRALDFSGAFSRGFSTGDRNAKEFIARTASLGIAVAPTDGTTVDAIFLHADSALSATKAQARGAIVFYEAAMEDSISRLQD